MITAQRRDQSQREKLQRQALLGLRCSHFFPRAQNPSVGLGSARVAASVPDLRPARAQKNSDAGDLSPGTLGRSWKDRDLLSDLRVAVDAAQFPKPAEQFRSVLRPRKGGCTVSN